MCRQDSTGAAPGSVDPVVATSERQQAHVLEADNGSVMRLSATAHFVLTSIDGGATTDDVAQELSRCLGRTVTAEQVEAAHARVRRQVDAIAQRPSRPKPFGLWFRIRLLPIAAVGGLSRRLSHVFRWPVAVPLLSLVALAAMQALSDGQGSHQSMMNPGADFLPLAGLFLTSMLAHELGHASASMRYGVPARDIGFGLYLIYPVFYNDVTAAWKLSRRQRVVIDLGGVFFQFVVAAAYVLIDRLTGWEVFRLAALGVFLHGVFVLLPIFKFDGYWLWSDLLGVPNLSRQVRRVAAHIRDRVLRRTEQRLPWSPWVSATVLFYGAFSALFLLGFASRLALTFGSIVVDYPARVGGLLRDLSTSPHTPASGRLSSVLGPTYILLGVTLGLVRMGTRLFVAVRPVRSRRSRGRAGS